jgi:dipeptidyl aminopeptidase/acylaminoacyl peptidase
VYGLPAMIGDPKTDSAALAAVAPVELADKIKVPVLLAFGGGDNRVPFKHGTRMRDALVAAGQKPEWVVYKDEGHGWLRVENRIDFAQRMEAFLAQHLAPR